MKNFKENNKGFSLVELIVVIAIMVVLIAVLGSTILGYVDKSKYSKDISALDSINTAVKTFVADPSSTGYPEKTVTNLGALMSPSVDKGGVIAPILAEVFKINSSNPAASTFNNASKTFAGITPADVKVVINNGAVSIYVPATGDYAPYIAGTAFDENGSSTN